MLGMVGTNWNIAAVAVFGCNNKKHPKKKGPEEGYQPKLFAHGSYSN